MSSENKSVTETTVTFRATSSDTLKLEFINDVLTACNQVEDDNTSATLRFIIGFVFNILKHVTSQRAGGDVQNSINVDLSFLELVKSE